VTVDRHLGEGVVCDGCAAIWCQVVMQVYCVRWLCSYMVVVITLPLHLHKSSAFKTSVYTIPGRGRQFPPNNIKLPISFELVNNQYMYQLILFRKAHARTHTHNVPTPLHILAVSTKKKQENSTPIVNIPCLHGVATSQ